MAGNNLEASQSDTYRHTRMEVIGHDGSLMLSAPYRLQACLKRGVARNARETQMCVPSAALTSAVGGHITRFLEHRKVTVNSQLCRLPKSGVLQWEAEPR